MGQLLRRCWYFIRRARFQTELAEELEFHRSMKQRDLEASGLESQTAESEARRTLGSLALAQDRSHDLWVPGWLQRLGRDCRFTGRQLMKSPAFFVTATLTLAVGICATTALASVANALLFRLPLRDSSSLVRFTTYDPVHHIPAEVSVVDVQEWRSANRTLESIAGIGSTHWTYVMEGNDPVRLQSVGVSGNFFDVVGSRPLLGRTFGPEDDIDGAPRTVVLSYRLWHLTFDGDRRVIGRSLRLSGSTFTVIGVMPASFRYPVDADVWTPVIPELAELGRRKHADLLSNPSFGVLHVVGRLKPGVAIAQAQGDLSRLVRGAWRQGFVIQMVSLADDYFGRARTALIAGVCAAFLLLLIASANVAGLFIARGMTRRREWSIRRAIGGGTADILRCSAAEPILVGILATAAAWAATPAVIAGVLALDPTGLLTDYPVSADSSIFSFAVIAGVMTTVLVAIGASWESVRAMPVNLTGGMQRVVATARLRRATQAMQVALTSVLLIGTGLMVRSVINLGQINLGFDPEHLLVISGADEGNRTRPGQDQLMDGILSEVRTLPGVRAAGVYRAPLQGPIGNDSNVVLEGDLSSAGLASRHPLVNAEAVTTDYFETMRIPIVEGRSFMRNDREGGARVAIVSRSLARQLWPGQRALGKIVWPGFSRRTSNSDPPQWTTVVGVAADVTYRNLSGTSLDLYLPVGQANDPVHDIVIRTPGQPGVVVGAVQSMVRRMNPGAPILTRSAESMFADATGEWRIALTIIGLIATVALLLSMTGLHGLLSYSVQEQTTEIGIRMALGAERRQVLAMILRESLAMTGVGVAIGLVVGAVGAKLLATLLYGVASIDVVVFTGGAVLLLGFAVLATLVPARRAAALDPVVALRFH